MGRGDRRRAGYYESNPLHNEGDRDGVAMPYACRHLRVMPKGTREELTGLLLAGDCYPVLRVAGGGEWRLDISRRYRHLLGQRVCVTGLRSDFDLLDVDSIGPE